MNNSMTSKIVLNNYKRDDGKSIVLIQIIINRKKLAINTGISIQPYLFNKTTSQIIKGGAVTKSQAQDYNLIINQALSKANEVFIRARLGNIILTPFKFKELYNNQVSYAHIDFIKFMDEEIIRLKGARENSSIKTYIATASKLSKFKNKIMFDELNISLLEDFERFMTKIKLAPNTRSKHHKIFKSFINYAIKRDIKIENPYNKFLIKRMKGNRDFLNREELDRLVELYKSKDLNIELHNVLEYFLFCCHTGLRISDIQILNSRDIIDNMLIFTPVKTKNLRKIVKIPLSNFANNIIKGRVGKLFPTVSDQATNKNLKDIAEAAKIKKNLTFHVARHTFATTFLRIGGSVEVLQKLLGHSKLETTMEYVHIVDRNLIDQMKNFNNI